MADKFDKALGENIKHWRKDRGYSQEDLAKHMKLSRVSIVNMESARHSPGIKQIIEICHFLGVALYTMLPMEYYSPRKTRQKRKKQ